MSPISRDGTSSVAGTATNAGNLAPWREQRDRGARAKDQRMLRMPARCLVSASCRAATTGAGADLGGPNSVVVLIGQGCLTEVRE
jgi:hypothetical protein